MNSNDIFRGLGVKITLKEYDDFLKVKETLTRIGVASREDKVLYQSCHILHKQGEYAIMHFKELFALDGKPSSMTDDDTSRRNTIANLLNEWGLVDLVIPVETESTTLSKVKILPHKEKCSWELVSKYSIGT